MIIPPHSLFNLEIPLGTSEVQFALTPEFLAAISRVLRTPGCEHVEFRDAHVINIFSDWAPESADSG